ncbi:VWA domain-containing protein [Mycobacterium sp. URHB0044]|jgi:Ca-activated chloride channel family protein|uniref:VWA domain-containing protein n=1 Tax=Mycobacterium sp. URHB0044 TaxID=1380386 RepID=UPI00048BDECA|nr:VWA domain-containing protein [Mycobacterium sp. URHB0044]
MALPWLGPMTVSGFQHPGYFLFLFVVIGVIGLYVVVQMARRSRATRPTRWRHVPASLLVLSLVLFTIAMAGPTHDVQVPRDRAVVMLAIDVSQSMRTTDVSPSRLAAAQEAAKQFASQLAPGIDLGLVSYAGSATVLVSPTTDRDATKHAIDELELADRTATGEAIFTALQAIGDEAPARIVVLSDGDTVPADPNDPKGAYTAARAARDEGVPISTISFGMTYGFVEVNNERQPVPVGGDEMLPKIAELSGGESYSASNLGQLEGAFSDIQEQFGYETIKADASAGWLRLGAVVLAVAALAALLINRRLPN